MSTKLEHPRGVLEWKKAGIDLSTTSDEAAKLFDHLFHQALGLYEAKELKGLVGTLESIKKADEEWIFPRLIELKFMTEELALFPNYKAKLTQSIKELDAKIDEQMNSKSVIRKWSSWEMDHAKAMRSYASGFSTKSVSEWDIILKNHPQDPFAAFNMFLTLLMAGQSNRMYESMMFASEHCPKGHPYYSSLLSRKAFGAEEIGLYQEAERDCQAALDDSSWNAWAGHTMAHIYEAVGDSKMGLNYLDSPSPSVLGKTKLEEWVNSCAALSCHMVWHNALFHLRLGNWQTVLDIWDEQLVGFLKMDNEANLPMNVFKMSDVVSLLMRLDMLDYPELKQGIADRWRTLWLILKLDEITDLTEPLTPFPFYDTHLLFATAACVRKQTSPNVREKFHRFCNSAWKQINEWKQKREQDDSSIDPKNVHLLLTPNYLKAVQAYADGDDTKLAEILRSKQTEFYRIGGSNAQRGLFNELIKMS